MTVVPLFCANLIKSHHTAESNPHDPERRGWGARFNAWFNHHFNNFLEGYDRALDFALKQPVITVLVITGLFIASLGLFPLIGKSYFPRTDPSQFLINVKAPSGTRLELTDQLVGQVEQIIREVRAPARSEDHCFQYRHPARFSSILTPNSAPHTAFVQVALNEGHKLSSFDYMDRVRARLRRELPQVSAYFQTGGLVDAIVNQGVPAPIDVQISSIDMNAAHDVAAEIARQARRLARRGRRAGAARRGLSGLENRHRP